MGMRKPPNVDEQVREAFGKAIGCVITDIRALRGDEVTALDLDDWRGVNPILTIELAGAEGKLAMLVSADPEGNGPGWLQVGELGDKPDARTKRFGFHVREIRMLTAEQWAKDFVPRLKPGYAASAEEYTKKHPTAVAIYCGDKFQALVDRGCRLAIDLLMKDLGVVTPNPVDRIHRAAARDAGGDFRQDRDHYSLEFTDSQWEEIEALGFEGFEPSRDKPAMLRVQWMAILDMALGKAARCRVPESKGGLADDEPAPTDGYEPNDGEVDFEKWAADLEAIAAVITGKFKPGDGQI